MKSIKETKVWTKFMVPFADLFWPEDDCAVCFFWRALICGFCLGLMLKGGIWIVVAAFGLAALLLLMEVADNTNWLDKL